MLAFSNDYYGFIYRATQSVEVFCAYFDSNAVKAINNGRTIVDIDCASGAAVKAVYNKTMKLLFEEGGGLRS